jgi:hypothetical protein
MYCYVTVEFVTSIFEVELAVLPSLTLNRLLCEISTSMVKVT